MLRLLRKVFLAAKRFYKYLIINNEFFLKLPLSGLSEWTQCYVIQ